jgi:23S rRNA pseudouridine955/2504/2580 synthase
MRALPILYRDDEIVVVDKPAGLAVQGGAGVTVALIDLLETQLGFRPFLVHRLDRDTSGALAVALNQAAAARWSGLFESRGLGKVYWAVCSGAPAAPEGTIATPVAVRGEAKSARTDYRVLCEWPGCCLVELELGTGRMHQLRIHLASIGLPILGDDKYGDFALNKRWRKDPDRPAKRLLLHARRLTLPGGRVVEVPPPAAFAPFLPPAAAGASAAGEPADGL